MTSRADKRDARLRGSAARSLDTGEFKITPTDLPTNSRELKNLQSALVKNEDLSDLPRRASFYRLPGKSDAHVADTPTRTNPVENISSIQAKRLSPKKKKAPLNKTTPLARKSAVDKNTIQKTLNTLKVKQQQPQPSTTNISQNTASESKEDGSGSSWFVNNGNKLKQLLRTKEARFVPTTETLELKQERIQKLKLQQKLKPEPKQKLKLKLKLTARITKQRKTNKYTRTSSLVESSDPGQLFTPPIAPPKAAPILLSKATSKGRQRPMVIELDRLTHRGNQNKRFKVNRLDALKHLVNTFQRDHHHNVTETEFRLNFISYLDNLLSLTSNIQDILKRLKQIQREKNEWRQKIFDLRQQHSHIGNELGQLRQSHNQIKATYEDTKKMVDLADQIHNTKTATDNSNSNVAYLAEIILELSFRTNMIEQLKLFNCKLH